MLNGMAFYIADPDNPDGGELVIGETPEEFMICPLVIPGPFRFVPKRDAVLYRLSFDIPWFAPHIGPPPAPIDHVHPS